MRTDFNDLGILLSGPYFSTTTETSEFNESYIDSNERSCINCVRYDSCWNNNLGQETPQNFEFRNGWDGERFTRHMKDVNGQVCGNFETVEQRNRSRRRKEKKIESRWDSEENL